MKKFAIAVGIIVVVAYLRGIFNPPISISFRKSLMSESWMSGYVLQVQSLSNKPIECSMAVYNDSANQKIENIQFVIQPGETQEIGSRELNWVFVPDEHGWVSVSGYLMKLNYELKKDGRWRVW